MPRRRTVIALAALLVLAATGIGYYLIAPSRKSCTVSKNLVNSCRPLIGVWASHYSAAPGGSGRLAQTRYFETRLGHQADVFHVYHTGASPTFTQDELTLINRPNTTMLLNYRPTKVPGVTGDTFAQGDGSNALVNANIDTLATSIKALGEHRVMLAIWHEPEYDVSEDACGKPAKTSAKAGSQADYVAMWHNIRKRFDALGVSNVVWVFNLASDFNSQEACEANALYPGDNYVDWVTWDPYGRRSHPGYSQTMSSMYNLLLKNSFGAHNYKSKPWGLSEYATTTTVNGDGTEMTTTQAAAFYRDAIAALRAGTYSRVKMYTIFDSTAPYGNHQLGSCGASACPGGALQDAYNSFADAVFAAAK